jgi:uncharacterized protein (TIGR02246 family)
MPANRPEEICTLFQRAMAEGDLDAVMRVYDEGVVFLNQKGDTIKGIDDLRRELTPLVAQRPDFDFTILQVIEAGDVALMHTEWRVAGREPMRQHAIEVARRQADGTWRWQIGDPFTIGKHISRSDVD